MRLQLDNADAAYIIRGYDSGRIFVNDEALTRSFVVTPDQLLRDWPPQTIGELRREHFQVVADLGPEIVLFGTGNRLCFPATEITAPLNARNIGVEVMDTAAACRSFSILAAEGRRVAAALLMIDR